MPTTTETTNNNAESGAPAASSLLNGGRSRHPMEQLLKTGPGSLLKAGDIVEGEILQKDGPRLFVDLGIHGTGIIYGREYKAAHELIKSMKIGDLMSAKVVEPDNEEGYAELSLKEAGEDKRWLDLKKCMSDGTALELPVLEANRGGLILEAFDVKGFIPTSQLSSQHYPRVDGGEKEKILQELQKLVGQTIAVKILDVDQNENKLIFTERGQDEERLRQARGRHKVGDMVEGEITGVVDFGAFLKFDEAGLEGLIHISEIDWSLIEDPRQVLKPGDTMKAKIIDIQGDKVSLSLKALKEDPWIKAAEKYKKGDEARAKVTKFNPFGAFAELGAGVQGLVHISEFGTETRMKEELELDQEYDFKILLVDPREHRMSLGMTRKEPEPEHKEDSHVSPVQP